MHYFGVPTCPYCKKRVNLIRTWSLKRQGEYQCPRCGGISNIYLSPLVYVLALLAVFSGGAMYFFHKFVLDDIALDTAVYVFIPFAVFFLFSLFMVYLEKPVIKKVSKEEYKNKRRIRSAVAGSAGAVPRQDEGGGYYGEDDYVPRGSYRPGPEEHGAPRQGVVNQAAFSRAKLQAAVENTQQSERLAYSRPQTPAGNMQNPPLRQRPAPGTDHRARPQPQPQGQVRVQQPRPAEPRAAGPEAQRQAYSQQHMQRRPQTSPRPMGTPSQPGHAPQSGAHMSTDGGRRYASQVQHRDEGRS